MDNIMAAGTNIIGSTADNHARKGNPDGAFPAFPDGQQQATANLYRSPLLRINVGSERAEAIPMQTTTTRDSAERAVRELDSTPRDGLAEDSSGSGLAVPVRAQFVGRGVLLGMAVCTAAGLAHSGFATTLLHAVTVVVIGLCQLGLGEQLVHGRPTGGWRTAFAVDLALLPTILAIWAAAEFARWTVVILAAAFVLAWVCFALFWCGWGSVRSAVAEGQSS